MKIIANPINFKENIGVLVDLLNAYGELDLQAASVFIHDSVFDLLEEARRDYPGFRMVK